jgi:hypothetical protein
MISRGTIIAGLVVLELAVLGEIGVALHGGQAPPWSTQRTDAETASFPHLVEGGPHKTFATGGHPAVTVDIGYADLTIVTGNVSQIDVALSRSRDVGFLRSRAPITAREDGETIRIAATDEPGWSTGDDRMLTVVVPPETQVTVVNAGDIRANGLRAESSFNSNGNGSVTIKDYDAPALHVTASNGPISLHEIVAARLDATSGNDSIEGFGLQVRGGSVEASDRITLGFALGADTLVSAHTNDGKVNVSGFSAAASVHKSSGDNSDDSSTESVRVGAGDGRLDVHTSDGNINLTQES